VTGFEVADAEVLAGLADEDVELLLAGLADEEVVLFAGFEEEDTTTAVDEEEWDVALVVIVLLAGFMVEEVVEVEATIREVAVLVEVLAICGWLEG
jgi:hypothetical protein